MALLILGVLATAGKLPGNGVIGLRVPEVRKHESTWRQAHRVTGPFWVLAAVAFAIGAAFAFIAYGWMWILVAVAVVAGFVSISVGGNFGARAAALVDAALDASDSDSSDEPAVDLGALRKAAGKADEQQ
ncbi:SdpI family protein [Corynebacterium sp. HMSC08D02]|uniref:SdpI family protein n=1 Tax=Corynebacterium sp. HMSC08D02 TaxID=1581138 RepID=UPI001FEE84A0|nr:SdpI family protein [Corynebacterium sp. HMSC08D02]